MYTIHVEKECGCFKKSEFENNKTFNTEADAKLQAGLMITHMNTKFCQKHEFVLSQNDKKFTIEVGMQEQPTHSGCCGGGHCS
jgi:hypothetical protein